MTADRPMLTKRDALLIAAVCVGVAAWSLLGWLGLIHIVAGCPR